MKLSKKDEIDLMRLSPLFKNCSNEEIAKFLTCNYPPIKTVQKENLIHAQEEPLDDIILVLSGEIALEKTDINGHSLIVDVLKAGDVFGQATVFGDENNSPMSLICLKETTYAKFKRDIFYRTCSATCKSHERVIKNMMTLLANQTRILTERVDCLATTSIKSKVARYLLKEAKGKKENEAFIIPYNREALALYLGVKRPSLSRTLTQMAEEGIISFNRASFKITDFEALEDLK